MTVGSGNKLTVGWGELCVHPHRRYPVCVPHMGWCVPSVTYVPVCIPYVQVLMTWYVPSFFKCRPPHIYPGVCIPLIIYPSMCEYVSHYVVSPPNMYYHMGPPVYITHVACGSPTCHVCVSHTYPSTCPLCPCTHMDKPI